MLIYDYQGYGASLGRPSLEGICDDGIAAYQYLVDKEKVRPENLVLYGESLGAAVATYVSREHPCRALILQSSFTSLRKIAIEVFPLLAAYPQSLFPQPSLDTIVALTKPHPPVLIIHGRLDQVVPFAHGQALYSQACPPKQFLDLPTSGHADLYETAPRLYVQTIGSFWSPVLVLVLSLTLLANQIER